LRYSGDGQPEGAGFTPLASRPYAGHRRTPQGSQGEDHCAIDFVSGYGEARLHLIEVLMWSRRKAKPESAFAGGAGAWLAGRQVAEAVGSSSHETLSAGGKRIRTLGPTLTKVSAGCCRREIPERLAGVPY
jgi:hypothetical protein